MKTELCSNYFQTNHNLLPKLINKTNIQAVEFSLFTQRLDLLSLPHYYMKLKPGESTHDNSILK